MLWKNPSTPAGFEPANLGSSGEYDNHGTTGVDSINDLVQASHVAVKLVHPVSAVSFFSSFQSWHWNTICSCVLWKKSIVSLPWNHFRCGWTCQTQHPIRRKEVCFIHNGHGSVGVVIHHALLWTSSTLHGHLVCRLDHNWSLFWVYPQVYLRYGWWHQSSTDQEISPFYTWWPRIYMCCGPPCINLSTLTLHNLVYSQNHKWSLSWGHGFP